jgi:hypothetical protein
MEDKLELIDEIMSMVIELDIDIYFNDEETYDKLCVTDTTSRISNAAFKLKQLIKKDHGNK